MTDKFLGDFSPLTEDELAEFDPTSAYVTFPYQGKVRTVSWLDFSQQLLSSTEERLRDLERKVFNTSPPLKGWGRIGITDTLPNGGRLTGAGISGFEQNPNNDTPGYYRIYLSPELDNYSVLVCSSDAEGMITVVNVINQTRSFFDIAIYGIEVGQPMPTNEVSFAIFQ